MSSDVAKSSLGGGGGVESSPMENPCSDEIGDVGSNHLGDADTIWRKVWGGTFFVEGETAECVLFGVMPQGTKGNAHPPARVWVSLVSDRMWGIEDAEMALWDCRWPNP